MSSTPIGSEGSGGVPPPATSSPQATTENEGLDTQVFIDQLEEMMQGDDNIRLLVKGQINLPPGRISIVELTELINEVMQELKKALNESRQLDPLISEKYHRIAARTAESIEDLHSELSTVVDNWRNVAEPGSQIVQDAYPDIVQATEDFNDFITSLWPEDRAAIQDYNQMIQQYNALDANGVTQIYNGLTQTERDALLSGLSQQQIDAYGGTEAAVVAQYFNQQIEAFNQYAASRPDVQAAINNLQAATQNYNAIVEAYNTNLAAVNAERLSYGLPALPLAPTVPDPNPNLAFITLQQQPLIPAPLLPPQTRSTLTVPNASQTGEITLPPSPGAPVNIESYELMILYFIPVALSTFSYLGSFNRALDLANELIYADEFAILTGNPLTLPFGFFEQTERAFLDSVNAIAGVGLASFAIGLHTRTLEIALSRAIFQTHAKNYSLPISARLFARLQFTALELLSKSSLLSVYPSIRFLASRFGSLAGSSPAVQAAISLAFAGQIGSLVSGDIVRGIVNGQINRLGFFARHSVRSSAKRVARAERKLEKAIASGNPFRIASAVNKLTRAHVRLANAVRLHNAFGALSIGGYAAFTNQVAASLNISLLGVSTALFARTLGIPGLVPQVFAQITHLDPADLLIATTAGSTIRDVLDNPVSVLFIKQTLADHLVYQLGYSTGHAAAIVNHAINNIVLASVGLQTFSRLRNELRIQFAQEGLNPFQANRLANETAAMIRGDLGVQFLNAAFGVNVDTSLIASSIVNNLYGFDAGIAGAMLSNAVIRSLQYGGYGSRVRLQNEISEQMQTLGLSRADASDIAAQYASFIETVGTAIPLTQYPGLASALLGNGLLKILAFGGAFAKKELTQDLIMRGLNPVESGWIADQLAAVASGNFVRPSDESLFQSSLESAVKRALTYKDSFETQREFRNQLVQELRDLGFKRKDARFLANSIAAYAVNGNLLPILGIPANAIENLNQQLVGALKASGISGSRAEGIASQAFQKAIGQGPFSSPDDFHNTLKEEVFKEIKDQTGRVDGHTVFSQAIANTADPSTLLGLAGLIEQISGTSQGILREDLGTELAQQIHNQLLHSLLGGTSVDEISNEETRNPLSILNQLNDQVEKLTNDEEVAYLREVIKKLQEIIGALSAPNPEHRLLGANILDAPSSIFGAANVSEGGNDFQPTQIPV